MLEAHLGLVTRPLQNNGRVNLTYAIIELKQILANDNCCSAIDKPLHLLSVDNWPVRGRTEVQRPTQA